MKLHSNLYLFHIFILNSIFKWQNLQVLFLEINWIIMAFRLIFYMKYTWMIVFLKIRNFKLFSRKFEGFKENQFHLNSSNSLLSPNYGDETISINELSIYLLNKTWWEHLITSKFNHSAIVGRLIRRDTSKRRYL